MLCGLAAPDKNHRQVQAIPFAKNGILVHVDLAKDSPEFAQKGGNRGLGFVAEVTTGPRIERHISRGGMRQALIFRMAGSAGHGLRFTYF